MSLRTRGEGWMRFAPTLNSDRRTNVAHGAPPGSERLENRPCVRWTRSGMAYLLPDTRSSLAYPRNLPNLDGLEATFLLLVRLLLSNFLFFQKFQINGVLSRVEIECREASSRTMIERGFSPES